MCHVGEIERQLPHDHQAHRRAQLVSDELWTVRSLYAPVLVVEVELEVVSADLSKRLQVGVDAPVGSARGLYLLSDVSVSPRPRHEAVRADRRAPSGPCRLDGSSPGPS